MTKFRYPETPHVGIGVVVWRDGKVLLVKRKNPPAKGQWGLPGGKQQLGETIFKAAVREVREETEIDIAPVGIITALDAITRDKENKVEFHYTLVEVTADWFAGEAKAGDDALEVQWAAPDEVEKICAWPEVARVVRLSMLQRVL